MNKAKTEKDNVRDQVQKRYGEIAKSEESCCCNSSPLGNLGDASASSKLGYSLDEMAAVPEGSNMGLGCGNPGAIAALKEGEIVLDLGCGGGFDCFLASPKVGPTGKVIGVDMTSEMLSKARTNAENGKYHNVEFRLGEIEHLPTADSSVDAIISNCVINLSPDKKQVYKEAYRVLKPGGRVAVSDVVATCPIPDKVKNNSDNYCGCISGAITVTELEQILKDTGFKNIKIQLKEDSKLFIKDWFPGSGIEDYVLSAKIEANKASPTYKKMNMEEKTKELIAIGASVTAHWQPCLDYHIEKARSANASDKEIGDAVTMGKIVEKGIASAMKEHINEVLGSSDSSEESNFCCYPEGEIDNLKGKCCK